MLEQQNKRICFISSRCGYIDESDKLYIDWANGRLLQELVKRIPELNIAVFSEKQRSTHQSFEIRSNKVYKLPTPFTQLGGIKNTRIIYKVLKEIQRDHDLLIVQLPFIGFISLFFLYRPVVFHVCANVLTAARNPFKYRGLKLLLSRSVAFVLHNWFNFLFGRGNSKVIVNGPELGYIYRKHNPEIVISSSVFNSEIVSEADFNKRNPDAPFEILFIGRPSKEKGFPTLQIALFNLLDAGFNVRLSMLGITRNEFNTLVEYSIHDKYLSFISFYGYLPWGDEFKRKVRSSHCLVMSSVSEGTPRVIVEAMALGCPVIASRIGGVTGTIQHQNNGLLFESLDADGLTRAIESIYTDESLRQQIMINGLEAVRNYTLEKFVDVFVKSVND